MQVESFIQRTWYEKKRTLSLLLLPLSGLFALAAAARRALFRLGVFGSVRLSRPVIVVGNITVGGTGKTPVVAWLAQELRKRGHTPGIIARGYGGTSPQWPVVVSADSDPILVGDEAVLLAQLTHGVVVAGPDRVAAAQRCIERGATVVISDDGLQHYRLRRDFEIAVVDGARGLGNGRLLPAGPLRERSARLRTVDAVMINVREDSAQDTSEVVGRGSAFSHLALSSDLARQLRSGFVFRLAIEGARNLATGAAIATGMLAQQFAGRRVHAVAGIGHPEAFFASLRACGLDVDPHPLADHAALSARDLRFGDAEPVLMTEKDAVKCTPFADERCWAIAVKVEVAAADAARLLGMVEAVIEGKSAQ